LELTDEGRNLSRGEAHLLSDNLCNLLALATGSDTPANTTVARLQLESLLAYCRQNLDDPTMSPSVVASRFGISVRTLHLRFRDVGQTFGRWLIENRLEACSKALIDAHQRGCNVSEIAYRWGFNDISHFNRAFRARYGMTPRQWRHASGE
jgi:AraC family transcriptional activator of tynA and feaB